MAKRFLLTSLSSLMIFSDALISRFFSASTEEMMACSTMLPSRSTSSFTCWISLSNVFLIINTSTMVRVFYYLQLVLTILTWGNTLFIQPHPQAFLDLVAHVASSRQAVCLVEFRRVVERPVIVCPHIEKDNGTILLGI